MCFHENTLNAKLQIVADSFVCSDVHDSVVKEVSIYQTLYDLSYSTLLNNFSETYFLGGILYLSFSMDINILNPQSSIMKIGCISMCFKLYLILTLWKYLFLYSL